MKKGKKYLIAAIVIIVLLIIAAVVSFMIPKTEDGSNLDIDSVNGWNQLYDIYSGQAFKSLSENEQKEFLDKAITKLKDTYGFESFEYNIKQKPLVISLHYPDGRTEAVQLEPFDPKQN